MQAVSSRVRGHKLRIAFALKFLPTISTSQIGARRGFRDENNLGREFRKIRRLRDCSPQVKFNDQETRFGMRQELEMFGWSQFVIERNQHTAAEKNRIGGNQPLRLIGHDDGGAISSFEVGVFEGAAKGTSHRLEVRIGEANFLAIAIGLDQAGFVRPAIKRIF